MKSLHCKNHGALLVATAIFTLTNHGVVAQTESGFYRPLTLAPAGAETGGGPASDDAKAADAELVKKSLNPVADLVSVPIQNNWDFGIGSADAMKYTANIQPVIPLTLNKDWNLITRTILPVIYQESRFPGDGNHSGLGDITQSFFLSPKEPVGGWILGAGPALLYPSATDSALGSSEWGAGPTIVALQQTKGWTYGLLANHIWSYAGWGSKDVDATYLQPFFGYSTKTYTTFMVNTESTYDWEEQQWTVPVNFMVSQMLKVGKQPIALQLGYRYYAEKPDGGPDWGLRFTVTFLFPKH
jgi:hypothetical protein